MRLRTPFWIALFLVFGGALFALKHEFNFLGLHLGMTQAEVTNALAAHPRLSIDESRYFGKINDATPFIIKATYFPYIETLYVQFYSNSAYGITVQFNPKHFDYFTILDKLEDKYGTPGKKSSSLSTWDQVVTNSASPSSTIQLRLEYPSTVKILDQTMMIRMNSEVSQQILRITNESLNASNRRALLDEL